MFALLKSLIVDMFLVYRINKKQNNCIFHGFRDS